MKRICTLLLIGILCLTACSQKTEKQDAKQGTEITPSPAPEKEYKDDTFSCSYNDSILKIFTDTANEPPSFICFNDDQETMSEDTSNGTILLAATQTHSISYNKLREIMLPVITQTIFDSLFQIENQTTPTVTKIENHIFEYNAEINGTKYSGRLFHIDSKTMTIAACRILPDEKQEYKDAIKSCYESIQYIKNDTRTLEDINKDAKKAAENAQEIISGDLYDSIMAIDKNTSSIIKMDGTYAISITSDNPKNFFKNCEKIYKNALKQKTSATFCMDTAEKKNIAMLTVVKDESSQSYPLHATLTVFDDDKEKDITSAYSKNKYWQSIDFDNLLDKDLQDIKDKYSK